MRKLHLVWGIFENTTWSITHFIAPIRSHLFPGGGGGNNFPYASCMQVQMQLQYNGKITQYIVQNIHQKNKLGTTRFISFELKWGTSKFGIGSNNHSTYRNECISFEKIRCYMLEGNLRYHPSIVSSGPSIKTEMYLYLSHGMAPQNRIPGTNQMIRWEGRKIISFSRQN